MHDWIPSCREEMILAANRLAINRLLFHKDAKSEDINTVFLAAYPKLIELGYKFLITDQKSCRLVVIDTPAEGMPITNLKDIILQSRLYIRPINGDIEVMLVT